MTTRADARELGRIEIEPARDLLGLGRPVRRTYSLDDIALVPASSTLDPDDVDYSWCVGPHTLRLPFVASAMDSVVDVRMAVEIAALGGLAVLNLEGLATRYDHPEVPLAEIAAAVPDQVVGVLQRLYR